MLKIFSLALIVGLLIAACGAQNTPAPTSVPLPSPTVARTTAPPAFIREIKLETQTGTAYIH